MRLLFHTNFTKSNSKDYDYNQILRRLFLVAFLMSTIGLVIFSKMLELSILHERQPKNVTGTKYENKILFRGIIKDRNKNYVYIDIIFIYFHALNVNREISIKRI